MELTDAQKQTLDELADAEDAGAKVRTVVTGSDPKTGCLHLRVQEEVWLLPNGLTTNG